MDADQHANKWGAISLSLVLNFVPLPSDRGKDRDTYISSAYIDFCLISGRMLQLAHKMLVSDGLLFLSVGYIPVSKRDCATHLLLSSLYPASPILDT